MATMPLIKRGAKGSAVKTLQACLTAKYGISCGSYGVDGEYGSATESAVKSFQLEHMGEGECDGETGVKTWTKLLS